jgi:bifunctional non-homologous end joining protein LigD
MLATPTPVAGQLPRGREWAFEVKWDGIRALADASDGHLRLLTRGGADVADAFPELSVLTGVSDALLDGEVVAMDAAGRPSFGVLAERIHVRSRARAAELARRVPATYVVFDVLRLYGVDLTSRPYAERRATLERLELPPGPVQLSPVYDDGDALLAATLEQGLEGVVSKRRSAPYLPGRRSTDWLKSPHRTSVSAVVGGWRPEKTNDSGRLGAVLLGVPDGAGGWRFAGRMGSGIAGRAAVQLAEALAPHTRTDSPFSDEVPRLDRVGATWVDPVVVVEARALEMTRDGRLRQPAYLGMRTDLTPEDLQEVDGA